MMKMSIRKIPVAILMASAMTLTACGGGGGGGGGGSTSGGGSLAISSANGRQVASASFDAFVSSSGGNRAAATVSPTGAEIAGSSEPSAGLAELLHGEILRALELDADQESTLTGAIITFSIDCTVEGTVTFEFNDANNNELFNLGESFTLIYNNCDFGASFDETFDGTFTLVFTSASPSIDGIGSTTDDWSYTATLTFTNFAITDKATGETETLNSDMTFSADFNSISGETATTLDGSFELENAEGTVAISNYRYSVVLLTSGGRYRDATIEGRATIGSLGGDVIVSTPVPLDNLSATFIWPEFGTLRAEATEGSGFVELNADTDNEETVMITTNDGSTATSETINWADL